MSAERKALEAAREAVEREHGPGFDAVVETAIADLSALDHIPDAGNMVASPPASVTEAISVERVECVTHENGYEEPADPIWRIEIDGFCADFETETAAQNFAEAIARLSTFAPVDGAVEALRGKIEGLTADLARRDAALQFYADISKYPAPFTGGMGALWSDCGRVARAALRSTGQSDPASAGVREADRQRIDDALSSCIGLLRAAYKDDIGQVATKELEFVRQALAAAPLPSAPEGGE